MYYRVVPFSGSFDSIWLTYKVPDDMLEFIKPGKIVAIPLKNSQELWLLMWEQDISQLDFDISDIKEIAGIISDFTFLSEQQCQMIDFIAQNYFCPIHHALGLFFPKNLLEKIGKNTYEKIKWKEYVYRESSLSLSGKQSDIYEDIMHNDAKKFLLYGVTGSGKTQIYMKLIEECLRAWKQTLLLIPEIILTSQIGERIKKEFGDDVLVIHSGVSAAKKSSYWMDIHSGRAKVIIGTRSALFYPYNNLGALIIDEEHDSSYISDSVPRYHSLDVAEFMAEKYNIPLLLWSGTPRTTTFYRALKGEFNLLQLLEKYQ